MKLILPILLSFLTLLPYFLIFIFILTFIKFKKNNVSIKWKTFKEKGFKPSRGNFGVYCYDGEQGKGKTYSVVEYLLDNKNDLCIFCNVKDIKNLDYFYFTGFTELIYLKNIIDLIDVKTDIYTIQETVFYYFGKTRGIQLIQLLENYIINDLQLLIVYDEIFTELQKYSKLNQDVLDFLCQMRKRKILFFTTAQIWAEIPLTFRRFCRYRIACNMFPFFSTGILIKTFYDAENMIWDDNIKDFNAPITSITISKTRSYVSSSYNTFLRISPISTNSN